MLLDNGYPVTIQKHKMIRSTASVVVKGADVSMRSNFYKIG